MTDTVVGRMISLANEAMDVFSEVMRDQSAKPSDRVAAAGKVLSMLGPVSDLFELRRRVDQLELEEGTDGDSDITKEDQGT